MVERTPHPLRVARLRRGLSQEALAAATNLSESTIKRLEAGARTTPHTTKLLSDYFRLRPAALGLLPPIGIHQDPSPKLTLPQASGAPALAALLRRVLADYSTLDNLIGPGTLLAVVPAQLAAVEQLLADASHAARSELLDVAARCAELAGWVHQDAGDLQAADRWTARAADYALTGGDPRLVSYVFMRRSNVASDAQDAGRALCLAQAALRDADRLTPQLRAVALRQEAYAHALRGDAPACDRALDRALTEVLSSGSTEPEFDLTAYCTPGYVGMEAAACWIQLDQPKRAIATFENRLSTWPAGYKRDLGLCLARLAVAHAANKDLEQAQAIGRQAVAVVRETHSARTLRELVRLDTLLRRWDGAAEAVTLQPILRDATGRPAVLSAGASEAETTSGGLAWS